jgi:hypothetical protein
MAFNTKLASEHVETIESASNSPPVEFKQAKNNRAPAFIQRLSHEERRVLEAKLRRKIDLRLLPMIVLIYIMNYLDRNNIASARLAGLEADLNLHGNQFQV